MRSLSPSFRALVCLAKAMTIGLMFSSVSVGAHEAAEHAPPRATPPAPHRPAASSSPGAAAIPFDFGGPFALIDQNGRTRTERDFRGSFMLVFFGYAGCEDMCPLTLGAMGAALDALGPAAARVQPLFITVDPARDTPARLRDWAPRVHARLVALTGDAGAVAAAMRAYRVARTPRGARPDGETVYAHGLYLYLMRPDGRFAALIPPAMRPRDMAALIRRYIGPSSGGAQPSAAGH
jgi:protein SCO1/2